MGDHYFVLPMVGNADSPMCKPFNGLIMGDHYFVLPMVGFADSPMSKLYNEIIILFCPW